MLIQDAIESIDSIRGSWVRVQQISRISGGIQLNFSVCDGRRGKVVDRWTVTCRGVCEAAITDWDGGGIASYPNTHPAAKQYIGRRARLVWTRSCGEMEMIAALYKAHVEAVDDWIPFDRYVPVGSPWNGQSSGRGSRAVSSTKLVCSGPAFLIRAYAKGLKEISGDTKPQLQYFAPRKSVSPQVLHFGSSYVVANKLIAERPGLNA